jgi:hypothetical protein
MGGRGRNREDRIENNLTNAAIAAKGKRKNEKENTAENIRLGACQTAKICMVHKNNARNT